MAMSYYFFTNTHRVFIYLNQKNDLINEFIQRTPVYIDGLVYDDRTGSTPPSQGK